MRKTILASAAIAFLFAGAASAADITDQSEVIFTVEPTCGFLVEEDVFEGSAAASSDGTSLYIDWSGPVAGNIRLVCTTGVAYTIETDAGAGGSMTLIGDATSGIVPAFVFQGNNGDVAFGSLANSEHMSGVGNGFFETIPFNVVMNSEDGGYNTLAIPETDVYRGMINYTFTY